MTDDSTPQAPQHVEKWDRRLGKVAVTTAFAVGWILFNAMSPTAWDNPHQYPLSEVWPAYLIIAGFVIAWVEACGWMFNGWRIFG